MTKQKIRTFLWFNNNAEEAAQFYTTIFPNSKITSIARHAEGGPGPAGSVMIVEFELAGIQLIALNGGPHFQFTEAISLAVDCHTQEEIDRLWEKLTSDGGSPSQCGWLKDKFGLSWQLVPSNIAELMAGPDPKKSQRVMAAMMQMMKPDLAVLQAAYDQA